MSVYEQAKRHAWMMLGIVVMGFVFIVGVDRMVGHSSLAFAVVVLALLIANRSVLGFNCPNCGSNLFFRRWLILPWPNRTCSNCGRELARND